MKLFSVILIKNVIHLAVTRADFTRTSVTDLIQYPQNVCSARLKKVFTSKILRMKMTDVDQP